MTGRRPYRRKPSTVSPFAGTHAATRSAGLTCRAKLKSGTYCTSATVPGSLYCGRPSHAEQGAPR